MMRNEHVTWAAHRYGLTPSIPEKHEDLLSGLVEAEQISMLDDPDRFVVAHVLLTRNARITHEAFPTWNGLEVDVRADGSVHVDPAQRPSLRRRWLAWAAADPRPDELPPDPEGTAS